MGWFGLLWAIGSAGAAAPPATWVEVGGNARVEFVDFSLGDPVDLPEGASCSALVAVSSEAVAVGEVPWDADRRLSRACDPAVLAAVQAVAPTWRLELRAWTTGAEAPLPAVFEVGPGGALRATLRVATYAISADAHPPALSIVEDARLVKAPEPRFPRSARKLVQRGELAPTVTCRLTLSLQDDGRVGAVQVDDCPEPLRPAVEALGAAYRFEPRKVNGVAVAAELPVAVVLRDR